MAGFRNKILTGFYAVLILSGGFIFPSTAKALVKLDVPFTPQAPYAIWTQPWQDACEETVILMTNAFYAETPKSKFTKLAVKKEIEQIVRLEMKRFGHHKDTPAAEIVDIINNYYPWEATVVENPSLEDLKNEINAGRPIILPIYGRALRNPYFLHGGPDYHTIVLAGFDDEKEEFITEEPGTRRGLDFRYSYATIMDAMHDFLPRNTKNGRRVAIFTSKETILSGDSDGDNDGLSKNDELRYGTSLWLKDTDNDGYSDSAEVSAGYSPTNKSKEKM